jgi:hypothetical protein
VLEHLIEPGGLAVTRPAKKDDEVAVEDAAGHVVELRERPAPRVFATGDEVVPDRLLALLPGRAGLGPTSLCQGSLCRHAPITITTERGLRQRLRRLKLTAELRVLDQ